MFTIAPLIIIISSIGVVLIIASRHLKKASTINLDEIPQEREAMLKRSILENRLLRRIDYLFKIAQKIFRPAYGFILHKFNLGLQKMRDIEKTYRFSGGLPDSNKKSGSRARQIINEAQDETKQGNFSKAESKYLTAIKVNPESMDAYIGLGDVYIKMNEHQQAKETFEYVVKNWPQEDRAFASLARLERLIGNMDEAKNYLLHALSINNEVIDYHIDLSKVYLNLGEKEKALSSLQKAQNLEPSNPKILDQLFMVSILLSNKKLAEEVLEKIKIANPDHGRLDEFKKNTKET